MNPTMMNTTALAYMGDAVYEVYVRKYLISQGRQNVNLIHKEAIKYVRARGQAEAIRELMKGFLSEEEEAVAKRGRNHKASASKRGKKHSNPVEDKLATAFEALIGFLYLKEEKERLDEIIRKTFEIIERKGKEIHE